MRTIVYGLPLAVVLLLPSAARAQSATSWGISTGVNMSNFTGPETNSKVGYTLGISVHKPINALWSFVGAGQLATKGSTNSTGPVDATISLTYFEMPLLLRATGQRAGTKPYFEFGPSVALKVKCEINAEVNDISVSGDCDAGDNDDPIKSLDIGVAGGAGVEWNLRGRPMTLGVRYTRGVSNLSDSGNRKNTNLQALVGLRLR